MHQNGYQSPDGKAPFEYAFGDHLWKYLTKHPHLQKQMMDYMAGRRKGAVRWVDIFPVAEVLDTSRLSKGDALLVDIGENQGHDLQLFQQRHSQLPGRLILEDLPQAVNEVKGKLEGIELVEYDFFTPQPIRGTYLTKRSQFIETKLTVTGAHIYFLKAILHDWSDNDSRKILANTVKVMESGVSRLLINEFVLPKMGVPLLPATLDIMMMCICAGVERTERHWREILDSVGLELVKIWTTDGVEAVIETMLKS